MQSNEKEKDEKETMVSMDTGALKTRLNERYKQMSQSKQTNRHAFGVFEYLWDLKEKALLEKRQTVSLPESILAEFENEMPSKPQSH